MVRTMQIIGLSKRSSNFITSSGGWLVLNLHGLDEEGWGPVSSKYLDDLLKRLVKIEYLEVLPAGEVLKRTNAYKCFGFIIL